MSEPIRETERPSGATSFFRYNIVALLATTVDFVSLLALKEIAGVYYVIATCLAATLGALMAFGLGRYWAFVSTDAKKSTQAFKYALVALGSIGLNTGGVFIITNYFGLDYKLSKATIAVIIAVAYNYPLSKYYTFK